jgi:hypothetical protein
MTTETDPLVILRRAAEAATTRCRHDMVAEWCAICRGTDNPRIVLLDQFGHAAGGPFARDGGHAPRYYRRAQRGRCESCGEPVGDADRRWSSPEGCLVGECCEPTP